MFCSQTFLSSQQPVPSPTGTLIASINTNRLEVRRAKSLQLIRSISISPKYRNASIQWSPSSDSLTRTSRIALATDTGALILNLFGNREGGSATITCGTGGAGKVIASAFGSSDDEFLTFADFGSKLTIWSLASGGRSVEIRDPKFSTRGRGYAIRPRSGHMAMLCRSGPQDVLLLLAANSREVIWSTMLPTTDAQGMSWSPDGKFLAVWDSASLGIKVHFYTAAGHLYRTYSGDEVDNLELGVRCLQWSPAGDLLAVGGFSGRVRMLSTRTFTPALYLDHVTPIALPSESRIWQEQVENNGQRSFKQATQQPFFPPSVSSSSKATADKPAEAGIIVMSFSADGAYLVVRHETTPTTVWIWDVPRRRPTAVLVHHSPVKSVAWHPRFSMMLMTQCIQDQPVLYLWEGPEIVPSAWDMDFTRTAGKLEARWLDTAADSQSRPSVLLNDSRSSMVIWPRGQNLEVLDEEEEEEDEMDEVDEPTDLADDPGIEDGDETLDSVYQALTGHGKSPFKNASNTEILVSDVDDEDATEILEDTFHGRARIGA